MKLKAAIIDDELHCIETLEYDIRENLSNKIEVVFTCNNGINCIKKLQKSVPDVLFMDIEMPGLSGFDLLEVLDIEYTKVVFTTAHARHAIKAINFKPEAYLLKPIDVQELEEVIDKIIESNNNGGRPFEINKLAISSTDEIELIAHEDIIFAKASNNYTELFLIEGKNKLVSKTLKHIESQLPQKQFIRIHKSYLINIKHLVKYKKHDGGFVELTNGEELPVSGEKKEILFSHIR